MAPRPAEAFRGTRGVCRLRCVGPGVSDHRNRFQPEEPVVVFLANAEHDKRPRATMGLADPMLTAVYDNGLPRDERGLIAC